MIAAATEQTRTQRSAAHNALLTHALIQFPQPPERGGIPETEAQRVSAVLSTKKSR